MFSNDWTVTKIFQLPLKDGNITPEKSAWIATNAASQQNSVGSGFSLLMRSFAIEEAPSPLPAFYATLLYTKIDQHRFWQNTKTWGPFLLPVPYKSWATFYLCCQFISDDVTWGSFLLYIPYKIWAKFNAVVLFLMMHRQMNKIAIKL